MGACQRFLTPLVSVKLPRLFAYLLIVGAIAAFTWACRSPQAAVSARWQRLPAAPGYYQQDLLQLLHTWPMDQGSPYLPHVQYYAATVDRSALRAYLEQHGMHVPSPEHYNDTSQTCQSIARALPEPFHPSMLVRNRTVRMQLPGGAPLALWRWDSGRITRQQWEAVPRDLRASSGQECAHCGVIMKFKVLNGRLYKWNHNPDTWQRAATVEMLQVVVHMYNIPDVDLILHVFDGTTSGMPVLGVNVNVSQPDAGFTVPYMDNWGNHAMSLHQAMVWADCLRVRYPRNTAIPRAVWRGSTTDPVVSDLTVDNLPQLARYKLHQLANTHWDVLDARVVHVVQSSQQQQVVERMGLPGKDSPYQLSQEQYQRYAVQVDMDGNSWSSRFFQTPQHTQAPVLKQASPLQAWYEHLFAPGGPLAIEHFAPDVHDAVARVIQVLDGLGCHNATLTERYGSSNSLPNINEVTCTGQPLRQQSAARRLQAPKRQVQAAGAWPTVLRMRQGGWEQAVQVTNDVAAVLLNKWSLIEATAYSITKYASFCDWKPQPEPDAYQLVDSFKAGSTGWLPAEVTQAIDQAARQPA